MKRLPLLTLFILYYWSFISTSAQTEAPARPVTASVALRAGWGQMRDTYLAPLLYSGANLSVEMQRWRLQRGLRWANWQLGDLSYSSGSDKGNHATSLTGRLRYRYGVLARLPLCGCTRDAASDTGLPASNPWTFYVGPYLGLDLGFDYNLKTASGNNPATARVASNAGVMAAAAYTFHPHGHRLPVMLEARTPLLGWAFMPEYGASYYETFYLANTDNNLHFTSLHNQQDLDLALTADLPLALVPWFRHQDSVLRLGASYRIETMRINDITTRYSAIELTVGWVFQYLPFGRHKSAHLLKNDVYEAY